MLKQFNIDGLRRVSGFLYISMGWVSIVTLPQLFHITERGCVHVGHRRRVALHGRGDRVRGEATRIPNPAVFGYHEIWHAFTAGAGLCHYSAVLLLILAVH